MFDLCSSAYGLIVEDIFPLDLDLIPRHCLAIGASFRACGYTWPSKPRQCLGHTLIARLSVNLYPAKSDTQNCLQ